MHVKTKLIRYPFLQQIHALSKQWRYMHTVANLTQGKWVDVALSCVLRQQGVKGGGVVILQVNDFILIKCKAENVLV